MKKSQRTKAGSAATELILEVFRLNGILIKSGGRLVKDLGLTSARWQVIGALALHGETMTVPQVQRRMGLSRQAVQRIANDLVARKWVAFQKFPADKRTQLLQLTAAGRDVLSTRQNVRLIGSMRSVKPSGLRKLLMPPNC